METKEDDLDEINRIARRLERDQRRLVLRYARALGTADAADLKTVVEIVLRRIEYVANG
jgi:hypothetical protein